ncbi:histidine kinase [Brachybacterium sacelli]
MQNLRSGHWCSGVSNRLLGVLSSRRAWLPPVGFVLAGVFFAVSVPAGFLRAWSLSAPPLGWVQWSSALVVAAATMLALPRRTLPEHVVVAGACAALTIVAVSIAMLVVTPAAGEWRPTVLTPPERYGLALLSLLTAYRCRPGPAVAVVAAAGLAAGSAPLLRLAAYGTDTPAFVLIASSLAVVVAAVSIGLLLRVSAAARAQQFAHARREERLALARDVHDTVAHHMTGVIVQAQASRHIAERDPQAAVCALDHIEQASTEALTAMRRVVAMLREDTTPAPRAPTELRAALHQLANATGPPQVRLTIHDDTDTRLPPEVSSTVLRITQESLTNARRHAHASHIDVVTRLTDDHVILDITDDGRGAPPHHGQGYGLVGLAERVDMLVGDFAAGPGPAGGWRVHARLPIRPGQS